MRGHAALVEVGRESATLQPFERACGHSQRFSCKTPTIRRSKVTIWESENIDKQVQCRLLSFLALVVWTVACCHSWERPLAQMGTITKSSQVNETEPASQGDNPRGEQRGLTAARGPYRMARCPCLNHSSYRLLSNSNPYSTSITNAHAMRICHTIRPPARLQANGSGG